MDEQNNINNGENGFQDPTVTPAQPDAAVQPVENNTAAEQPSAVNEQIPVPPIPPTQQFTPQQPAQPAQPPTYEQYASQQNQQAQQAQQAPVPPVYQNFQPNVQPVQQQNSMAVAALIVGIVANVCCGFVAGIPALILGIIALQKSKTMYGNGKGMAIAGIILGAVSIVWSIAAMVMYSIGIFSVLSDPDLYDDMGDFYSLVRMLHF